MNVFKGKGDRQKALSACTAFGCELWIGIYVETTDRADIYLTSEKNYNAKYRRPGKKIDDWKMGPAHRAIYASDPVVKHLSIAIEEGNWNWSSLLTA